MPTMFGEIKSVQREASGVEVDTAFAMIAVVALQELRGREGETGRTARNARKNEL